MNLNHSSRLRGALGLAALLAAGAASQSALATNVSISVHQPGVYGRVNIGATPPPVAWVRPQPVVFVQDSWVRERHAHAHGRPYSDRDRDGVANRYDRDRDGDGIRNSRDRRPNNPNWR